MCAEFSCTKVLVLMGRKETRKLQQGGKDKGEDIPVQRARRQDVNNINNFYSARRTTIVELVRLCRLVVVDGLVVAIVDCQEEGGRSRHRPRLGHDGVARQQVLQTRVIFGVHSANTLGF